MRILMPTMVMPLLVVALAAPTLAQPALTPVELQAAYCIGSIDEVTNAFQRFPVGKTPAIEQSRQSLIRQIYEKNKPVRDRYLRYLSATGTIFDINNVSASIGFSVARQRGEADMAGCLQYTTRCYNTAGCHVPLDPAPCVRPQQCYFPERLLPFPF